MKEKLRQTGAKNRSQRCPFLSRMMGK